MQQKTKILMASAFAITSTLTLGGLVNVNAAPASEGGLSVESLRECLEGDAINECRLTGDISPQTSSNITITIPSGKTKILDLNGYKIKTFTSGDYTYNINIRNEGALTIQDSGTAGEVAGSVSTSGTLTIKGGTFKSQVYGLDTSGDIIVVDGSFADGIQSSKNGRLEINGGTFAGSVFDHGDAATIINGGTFNGIVNLSSTGENKITDGDFNQTVYCSNENSKLEIAGGSFKYMNCISYYAGSKLTISGGLFTNGFSIGVETLRITGGEFRNGSETDGWLALILKHPDTQDYKITGGRFLNTADDYGTLMAIKTMTQPTDASIRSLFEGGTVLSDKWIEITGSGSASTGYWSYIKKVRTEAGDDEEEDEDELEEGIKVPDTGHNTMNGDNMSGTSLAVIIASVLACSLGLGVALYFSFHKKVSFSK